MNFIDKFRIKRNPNIIDSFSQSKIKNDMIIYALNCGYKFNPDTMGKFISYSNYREAFRDQDEVFEYLKQNVLEKSDKESKVEFGRTYNRDNNEQDKYVALIKGDNELSESFAKELKSWVESTNYLKMEHIIQIIDGKDELIDEVLQNHFETLENNRDFKQFADYIVLHKTPQELYNQNIKDATIDRAFINTSNPQCFLKLFNNFDNKDFSEYKTSVLSSIENNIEQFIPYLDRLDEIYNAQMKENLITEEIKNKALSYLKDNHILYDANVPKFALDDNEYVLQCIRTISNNYSTIRRFT